jgi:hypothetical protein
MYIKENEKLLAIVDELDIKAEIVPHVASQRDVLRNANDHLDKLIEEEEAKWHVELNLSICTESSHTHK